MVDVDVLLTKEHPMYEKPRPAEKVCIRPAIIEFQYCEEIRVNDSTDESIDESARRLRPGAIEGLQRLEDGRYEISGLFGTVLVTSERPLLRLKGP